MEKQKERRTNLPGNSPERDISKVVQMHTAE